MASQMDLLLEAERRGILPEAKKALLVEARKRGLVSGDTASRQIPGVNSPTIEDTGGQPTPEPTGTPLAGPGEFEGLDNPITQGIADAVYSAGAGFVDSLKRTFVSKVPGAGQTIEGFTGQMEEPGPLSLRRANPFLNIARESGETGKRIVDTAAGATEDIGNISLVAGPIIAGTRAIASRMMRVFPGLKQDTALKVAGEIISAQTNNAPLFARNAAEVAELEAKFPGLKFTVGQATADPGAIAAEKVLVNTTDPGKMAKAMQQVNADEAVKSRLQSAFPGEEGIEEVTRVVQSNKAKLARDKAVAEVSKDRATKALSGAQQPEDVGATLLSKAQEGKAAAKEAVRAKFGKIDPSLELPSEPLSGALDEIRHQQWGKKPEDYPSGVMDFIKGKIQPDPPPNILDAKGRPIIARQTPKPVTFGDTIEMRSQITDALRAEKARGPLANETTIKRLNQLLTATEETQGKLKAVSPTAYKDYISAKKLYREDYVPRFKQGATAEVIRKTATGDQYIDNALIGKEYFQPGNQGVRAAQDFQKTFGADTAARQAIKDYAAQDLLKAAKDELTGEISTSKLMGWVHRHKPAIVKYGLWDDFKDITSASRQLVKAQEAEAVFSKSYASKLLGVDADKAVANVFSGAGKKDSAEAAREIMSKLRGDKNAMTGMQNAVKDYLLEKISSTVKDAANNPLLRAGTMEKWMKDLDPALAVIYRNNPSKLTTLKETRNVIDTLRRSTTNLTGSSETAMFGAEAMRRGFGIVGGRWANFFLGPLKNASDREMNKILVNAYFNPEVAMALVSAVNKKTPPSVFLKGMEAMGLYRVAREQTELPENESVSRFPLPESEIKKLEALK